MSGFYILACHTGHYQVNGLLIQATQSYKMKILLLCVCVCVCTCVCAQLHNYVQLFEAPWTVTYQAPVPTEFFRQEY